MTTETEAAFAELLQTVGATHARMVEQLADDPADASGGAQVGAVHPAGGRRGERVGRQGPAPLRRDRGAVQEVGRRQFRRLLLLRADRSRPDLPGQARSGRRRLHVPDRLRRPGRRALFHPDRRIGQQRRRRAGRGRGHPHRHLPGRPRRARGALDPPRARRRGRHHPRLPQRSASRDGGPPGTSRPTIRPRPTARTTPTWPGASGPRTTWMREQASIVPIPLGTPNAIDPPYPVPTTTFGWAAGDAAYAMGAFELADDEALVIRGRSPECVFWNMCLWNRLLHTYNYDYERVTINGSEVQYEPDGSWIIVDLRPAPDTPQLGLHRRPRVGAHLVPLVPARPRHPSSPRWRCSRWTPYECSPAGRPHRRPGGAPLQRRGPRHPRLHGGGGVAADPRPRRAHGGRPRGDRAGGLRARRLRRATRGAVRGHAPRGWLQRRRRHAATRPHHRPAQEPVADRGPRRAPPGNPRRADRGADHHLRAAADRYHAPAQPHVGRPCAAVPPLLGEPGAGPARRTRSRRPARPTLAWSARTWRSRFSTPPCRTSTACTK